MYLLIDNYDSFTYNLRALFAELGCDVRVVYNDRVDESRLERGIHDGTLEGLIISPGPKSPEESGLCRRALARARGHVPVLGVCLGHQIVATAFGATVKRGARPVHGVVSALEHDGKGLFEGLPPRFDVTRYHSLVVSDEGLPACLRVDARSHDGAIMALSHIREPIFGLQFHPEAALTQHGRALAANFVRICDACRDARGRTEKRAAVPEAERRRAAGMRDQADGSEASSPRPRCAASLPIEPASADAGAAGGESARPRQPAPPTRPRIALAPGETRIGRTVIRTLAGALPLSDVFDALAHLPSAVFLDTATNNEDAFSIAAIRPYLVLEDRDGVCLRDGTPCARPFLDELRAAHRLQAADNPTDLPLIGGFAGYLSYDFGRRLAGLPSRPARDATLPDARMAAYDALLVEDRRAGTLHLIAHGRLQPAHATLDELESIVRAARPSAPPARTGDIAAHASPAGRASYRRAIARIVDYAARGHVYVANMTRTLRVESPADPYDVYRALRVRNPAPYAAYLNYDDARIACSSPERFIRVRGRGVETRPIKGTRPRGATTGEDRRLRAELAASAKERSELLMVTDLERNDLNRVCEPGSVDATRLFSVEDYATVFQLVSDVQGRLARGRDVFDLISAAFPGGSITGAPKRRAMEILDELECGARGLYTGSIGYLADNGDCDLNIVIRTAVEHDGVFSLGTGGGITCESDADAEFDETLLKARALLAAIADAEQAGLRTGAWRRTRRRDAESAGAKAARPGEPEPHARGGAAGPNPAPQDRDAQAGASARIPDTTEGNMR